MLEGVKQPLGGIQTLHGKNRYELYKVFLPRTVLQICSEPKNVVYIFTRIFD